MKILITGVAGFIGFSLSRKLLMNKNYEIIGIDNLDSYYSVKLKKLRLKELKKNKNFHFVKIDITNKKKLFNFFKNKKIDLIYHFAAQAGVRFSVSDPDKYFFNNIIAYLNMLEIVEKLKPKKFFFASSSSIYGDQSQKKYPLKENIKLNPKNIYGFSKYMNEIFSKYFSKKLKTKFIGLRFFTVFGEWGRPDMLIFKILNSALNKKLFFLNDNGNHYRDFTYIEDLVNMLLKLKKIKYKKNYQEYNLCSNRPIQVKKVISIIKTRVEKIKIKNISPKILKKIEVIKTHGSNKKILSIIKKYKFSNFDSALKKTVDWYLKNKIHIIS